MKIQHLLYTISLTCLIAACGSTEDVVAEGPSTEESVSNGEDGTGNGSTKLETFGSASPDDVPDVTTETEEVVEEIKGNATEIEWLDFETAIDRNKEEKKFIFIDMYTNWCGWCKKMDGSTFKDPSVINYIDQNFYAVKMNPESDEAIAYKETLYEPKQYGTKRYNELAVNLLANKMNFPSFVILNKREIKRGVLAGYHTPSQLISGLKRYVGN